MVKAKTILLKGVAMQILSIFFHPEPSITALGGAEKRFLETLKIWVRRGVKMTVIESKPPLTSGLAVHSEVCKTPLSPHVEKNWINIYVRWIIFTLDACLKGISAAKNQKPNLVLATNNTVPNLIPAYLIHAICHLPLCTIVHHIDVPSPLIRASPIKIYYMYRKIGYDAPTSILKTLALWIIIFILKHSDICIAVSRSTANALLQNNIPFKKIHISGNGVNINYIKRFKFNGNKNYDAVFVGRISKEKGVYSLLDIWKKVTELKPEAKLVIIGSGVELPKIKRSIKEMHLETNIIVLGPCTDKDMYTTVKASKVFVFPSLLEGWGLAVAEALACGLPAVCYDIPAVKEIFSNCKSVFLVPVGDINKFAFTILDVLRLDLNETAKISKAYVKHFSWSKIALKDLKIIRHAISNTIKTPRSLRICVQE